MTTVQKTLTILLADHGNSYTGYSSAAPEGRFEQYHPSLFMGDPSTVQKILGAEIMQNLRENQFNLFSMVDLHKALMTLPLKDGPSPHGVFGTISKERTCNDLQLTLPNFCVCQGWMTQMKNDSSNIGVLHFAVGQLNNQIQQTQSPLLMASEQLQCKLLEPIQYMLVTERVVGKNKVVAFDFEVTTGIVSASRKVERFHAEVQMDILWDKYKPTKMKLLLYDRISPYEPYRKCAYKDTPLALCICDTTVTDSLSEETVHQEPASNDKDLQLASSLLELTESPHSRLAVDHQIKTNDPIPNNQCLHVRRTKYPVWKAKKGKKIEIGFSTMHYEVANICKSHYNVTLRLIGLKNCKSLTDLPFLGDALPYSITSVSYTHLTLPTICSV